MRSASVTSPTLRLLSPKADRLSTINYQRLSDPNDYRLLGQRLSDPIDYQRLSPACPGAGRGFLSPLPLVPCSLPLAPGSAAPGPPRPPVPGYHRPRIRCPCPHSLRKPQKAPERLLAFVMFLYQYAVKFDCRAAESLRAILQAMI
jgi:hypothetical protein